MCEGVCMYLHLHVWVHICGVHVYIHAYACGNHKYIPDVMPYYSPPYFYDSVSCCIWSLPIQLDWLASRPKDFPVSVKSTLELQCHIKIFIWVMGIEMNAGFHSKYLMNRA